MNQRQTPVSLRLSEDGLSFIADREAEGGPILHAYSDRDPQHKPLRAGELTTGVVTIGYGHTRTAVAGMTITHAQALSLLRSDVRDAEMRVHQHVRVPLWQHEFDALVSLVFNVGPGRQRDEEVAGRDGIIVLARGGPSSLLKALNAGDYKEAAGWFTAWFKTKGAELGLYRRRIAEKLMFEGLPWLRAFNACRSLAYTEDMAYNDALDEATDQAALQATLAEAPAAPAVKPVEVVPAPPTSPLAIDKPATAGGAPPLPGPPAQPAPPAAAPSAAVEPTVEPKHPAQSGAMWGILLLALAPQFEAIGNELVGHASVVGGLVGKIMAAIGIALAVLGRMSATQPLSMSAPIRRRS